MEGTVSAETDPTFWRQITNWLWALLVPLVGIVLGGVRRELAAVKETADAALPKEDFEKHLERSIDERKTLRADVKELFNRDDKMKDTINERFEALRRDMHSGFDRLSSEIRNRETRS